MKRGPDERLLGDIRTRVPAGLAEAIREAAVDEDADRLYELCDGVAELDGDVAEYLRSLLDPVEPSAVLSLILADYNAELLFTWAVQSINGVENYASREDDHHAVSPRYQEFIRLMTEVQQEGLIGFKLEVEPESKHDLILFFNNAKLDDAQRQKLERARELIGLDKDIQKNC